MSRSDGRGDLPSAFRYEEHERRFDHMIRVGRVHELGYERETGNGAMQARVRVLLDGEISAWLPIATVRNGPNGEWDPPEVDEQVAVWAPSGVTSAAYVIGTIPSSIFPIHDYAERSEDRHLRWYKDLTTHLYDRLKHLWEFWNPNADGMHHFGITGNSEVVQTNDRIFLRIGGTSIEIVEGKITLDAALAEITGDLFVGGKIMGAGSIEALGGISTPGAIAAGAAINAVGPIASATMVTAPVIVENSGSLAALVAAEVAAQLAAGVVVGATGGPTGQSPVPGGPGGGG